MDDRLLFKGQDAVGPCSLTARRASENGEEKIIPLVVHGKEGAALLKGNYELSIDGTKNRIPIALVDGNWMSAEKLKQYVSSRRPKATEIPRATQGKQRSREQDHEHER